MTTPQFRFSWLLWICAWKCPQTPIQIYNSLCEVSMHAQKKGVGGMEQKKHFIYTRLSIIPLPYLTPTLYFYWLTCFCGGSELFSWYQYYICWPWMVLQVNRRRFPCKTGTVKNNFKLYLFFLSGVLCNLKISAFHFMQIKWEIIFERLNWVHNSTVHWSD